MTYKNGIRKITKKRLATEILPVVGMNSSLLKAPLYVLHPKMATKLECISIIQKDKLGNKVGEFHFSRRTNTTKTPFPTSTHAFWLDILMGLFASYWNKEGFLKFSFAEVSRTAYVKSPYSSGSRLSIIESICRYMRCDCEWIQTFASNQQTWSGPIIIWSDIWNDDGDLCLNNPRNSRTKDAISSNAQAIRFHPMIVEALNPDNPFQDKNTRLFLSSVFQQNLTKEEFVVYRYFYGHHDIRPIWRSLYDEERGLIKVFSWGSRQSRFLPWLLKGLEGLKKHRLIEFYELNENKTAIGVKCFNKDQIKDNKVIELGKSPEEKSYQYKMDQNGDLEKKARRKGATKKIKKIKVSKITDQAVMEEYLNRKEKGLIDKATIDMLDTIIKTASKKTWIPLIKEHILKLDN